MLNFALIHFETFGGVITYFSQSNPAGKVIIFLLIIASLIAWTLMTGKSFEFNRAGRLNRALEKQLAKLDSLINVDYESLPKNDSPYFHLTNEALQAYFRYEAPANDSQHKALRMGHVENALQRAVAEKTIAYESKMVILGSIVTGAPFFGLLGTVWGVMDAFGSMALQGGATLQNLAPGVSGSLLTTVAGLLVAIPSVFGYNYLLTQSKIRITELENFASMLADRIELDSQ